MECYPSVDMNVVQDRKELADLLDIARQQDKDLLTASIRNYVQTTPLPNVACITSPVEMNAEPRTPRAPSPISGTSKSSKFRRHAEIMILILASNLELMTSLADQAH
jgi:hypothetical protein